MRHFSVESTSNVIEIRIKPVVCSKSSVYMTLFFLLLLGEFTMIDQFLVSEDLNSVHSTRQRSDVKSFVSYFYFLRFEGPLCVSCRTDNKSSMSPTVNRFII